MEWNVDFEKSLGEDEQRWTRQTLKAQVFFEEGQHGKAAQELWEVLIEARHAENKKWECITLAHQGKVYRHIRNGICQKLLAEALKLSEKLDFAPGRLIALAELGETACLWGELGKAREMLEKALSLVRSDRDQDRRAVLLRLAMVLEGQGDFEEAKSLVREVLLIDRKLEIPDAEDREHLERLSGPTQPARETVAASRLAGSDATLRGGAAG
jgi:tetratricopeptide (TPR) repeat protein